MTMSSSCNHVYMCLVLLPGLQLFDYLHIVNNNWMWRRPGNEAMCTGQLTVLVVMLIFFAGVCMYHSGLKPSGS